MSLAALPVDADFGGPPAVAFAFALTAPIDTELKRLIISEAVVEAVTLDSGGEWVAARRTVSLS